MRSEEKFSGHESFVCRYGWLRKAYDGVTTSPKLAESRHRASEPIEDDLNFYRTHRGELKEDAGLKSKWDRFIFGSPLETGDFLSGLAMCLESLFDQDIPEGAKRELRIVADRRTKNDLKKLNVGR